jgi:hypothetical protein
VPMPPLDRDILHHPEPAYGFLPMALDATRRQTGPICSLGRRQGGSRR